MATTRLLVLRHGETAWNRDTRIQGHLDIPLNATGERQAQRLALALATREPIDAIYSSDLSRARQTAQAIAERLRQTLVTTPGLRERSFGTFQGRTFAEIETESPDDALRWRKRDPAWVPPGGGESLLQLQTRVLNTLNELAGRHTGQQIVLVAHGGVMDLLYRAATGQDLRAPRTWQLGNTAVNRLLWTPQSLTLVGWADTQHLQDETLDEGTA